jgi:hypothetical protein
MEQLSLSKGMIQKKNRRKALVAFIAKGQGLVKCNLGGNNVEPNDYVLVDTGQKAPNEGCYIVFKVNEGFELKKYALMREEKSVAYLLSDAEGLLPPMIVGREELAGSIIGTAVQVIKRFEPVSS